MKNLSNSIHINFSKLFTSFFIIGTILAIIETVISPHPTVAKTLFFFPAFKFFNLTFTVMEFFSLLFTALFIFFIILKSCLNLRFYFNVAPSKIMNFLILIFVINVFCAIVLGITEKNESLYQPVRNILTLMVIFPFYYYRKIIFKFRKFLFISINIVGLYFVMFTLIENIFGYTLLTIKLRGAYYGLYFSGFFLAYHLFKILIEKKSILSLFFVLLTLFSFSIRLTQKPVILEILVIISVVLAVSKFIYKIKFSKILLFGMLLTFMISPFFNIHYKDNQLLSKTLQRWTKIQVISDNDKLTFDDFIENVSQIEFEGARDISAKRFLIWKIYFSEAIKYPIVTPYFGDGGPYLGVENTFIYNKMKAHNIFFKYMYSVGLPAALCILFIILLFITRGWKWLKYYKYHNTKLSLKPFEAAAIYAFVIGMISVEFIGAFADRSAINSWWFWSLVVLFFSNFEIKNTKKDM